MRNKLSLTLFLAATWAALSGHYSLDPLIFGLGVLSILAVVVLYGRLLTAAGVEPIHAEMMRMLVRFPRFVVHLSWMVIRANLRVTRLLLDPTTHTEPRVLRMKVGPRTDLGQFLLANSITLTPGTVTLDLRDGEILVHGLGPISAASVVSGELDRAVRRVEGSL